MSGLEVDGIGSPSPPTTHPLPESSQSRKVRRAHIQGPTILVVRSPWRCRWILRLPFQVPLVKLRLFLTRSVNGRYSGLQPVVLSDIDQPAEIRRKPRLHPALYEILGSRHRRSDVDMTRSRHMNATQSDWFATVSYTLRLSPGAKIISNGRSSCWTGLH